jgi:hypothetical protein
LVQILQRCAEFLKAQNHWVGVAGILLGAALSAYFYFASKPAGEISLKFKTVKIAHAIPDIKILDAENNPISSDVFALEIVVWNSGDLPLGEKSDRLRRSIILVLDKGTRILAAQVQETANATLSELNTHLTVENESLRVEWQEFDPGDALKLSVIYSSKNQSNIDYRGRLLELRCLFYPIVRRFTQSRPASSPVCHRISPLIGRTTSYELSPEY